jgi:putative Mg2+ transporter-C (MgtC) family protein
MAMEPEITIGQVVLRLALATVLAGLVGVERERRDRAAGMRTQALVGLGACLFMIVSAYGFSQALGQHVTLDPSRVAAQIVSGISFLGAGTIVLRHQAVSGLTTAASVWIAAALGSAIGGGLYVAAIAATVLAFVILSALKPLERRLRRGSRKPKVVFRIDPSQAKIADIVQLLERTSVNFEKITMQPPDEHGTQRVQFAIASQHLKHVHEAMNALSQLAGVREVDLNT